MNETITNKITEVVNSYDFEEFTMYRVAEIFSTLKGERVREQMMYNYRKNNLIKVQTNGRCSKEELVRFLNKKLNK